MFHLSYRQKIIALVILALMAEAFFLRLFHLTDWLHFQLDQSRDAFLIKDVAEKGLSDLPLLGPRAGGSFLRLGPAYYYFLYLSAKIFGSTHPAVFVLPEILANLALIPLFYLTLRKFLQTKWALIIVALAVNSTFLVTYDRFSWNPNMLPFFSVLTIYAWLNFFEAKKEANRKRSLLWVAILALSVGLFSQMHFVSFVAMPVILIASAAIFWLQARFLDPPLAQKYLLGWGKELVVFSLLFLIVQTPLILNEYVSHGINTQQFFATVGKKENKDTKHSTLEKVIQNLWVYPKGLFISLTGNQGVDFPVWKTKAGFDIRCDDKCRQSLPMTAGAGLFSASIILIFVQLLVHQMKINGYYLRVKKEKIDRKKIIRGELLIFLTIWVLVPWWAFYSLSFALRPRFFLFSVVPFWIILGLILQKISRSNFGQRIAILAVIILLGSNIFNLVNRFDIAQSAVKEDRGNYPEDQILFQDEAYPVTLEQEKALADWIKNSYLEKGQSPDGIFLWAPSFYYRPILYLLAGDNQKVHYFSNNPPSARGTYFAITRSTDKTDFFRGSRGENFSIETSQIFGTLAVHRLNLSEKGQSSVSNKRKDFSSEEKIKTTQKQQKACLEKPKPSCRYTWGDVIQF